MERASSLLRRRSAKGLGMSPTLQNKTVLVTRPKDQAEKLAQKIRDLGAVPVCMPAISIAPPADWGPVDRTIKALSSYDWVVFTSANGVAAFAGRMKETGFEPAALSQRKLAAIGPATAAALAGVARGPDVVPAVFLSDAIADALGDVAGCRILLPRADIARQEPAMELAGRGAEVDAISAYSVVGESDPNIVTRLAEALHGLAPDFITLTSPSAARGLFALLQSTDLGEWMSRAKLVCIGPITAGAVVELGLTPAAVASEHTADGLVRALQELAERYE
jgi:uroporphyrinogen-III synthase